MAEQLRSATAERTNGTPAKHLNSRERPTRTEVDDQQAVAQSAMQTLLALMPALTKLGDDTENPVVKHQIAALREMLGSQLPKTQVSDRQEKGMPETQEKGKGFKNLDIFGKNTNDVMKQAAERFEVFGRNVATQVHTNESPVSLNELQQASVPALYFALREFDPKRSNSFEEFARPIVELCLKAAAHAEYSDSFESGDASHAIRIGTAGYRNAKPHFRHMESNAGGNGALTTWTATKGLPGENHEEAVLAASIYFAPWLHRVIQDTDLPVHLEARIFQAGSCCLSKKLRTFDPGKHGDDFMAYAAADIIARMESIRPSDKAITKQKGHHGTQSERDTRLIQWASDNGYPRQSAFNIQGEIIQKHISWMVGIRDAMQEDSTFAPHELKSVGYRLVKGLARFFDPKMHGDNFATFAEPYVRAGMSLCLERRQNVIPEKCDVAYLSSLLAVPKEDESPAAARESDASANIDDAVSQEPASSTPQTAEVEPMQEETVTVVEVQATVQERIIDVAERTPEADASQPDTKTEVPQTINESEAEAAEEPPLEERLEKERKDRFVSWACTLPDVGGHDFETLVQAVSNQYSNLAKSIAQRTSVPGAYRGGKKALKKSAIHKMSGVVREFDPAAGEHFNQYVQRVLGGILEEEVET